MDKQSEREQAGRHCLYQIQGRQSKRLKKYKSVLSVLYTLKIIVSSLVAAGSNCFKLKLSLHHFPKRRENYSKQQQQQLQQFKCGGMMSFLFN